MVKNKTAELKFVANDLAAVYWRQNMSAFYWIDIIPFRHLPQNTRAQATELRFQNASLRWPFYVVCIEFRVEDN